MTFAMTMTTSSARRPTGSSPTTCAEVITGCDCRIEQLLIVPVDALCCVGEEQIHSLDTLRGSRERETVTLHALAEADIEALTGCLAHRLVRTHLRRNLATTPD